ncbi:FAD-binding oxidoreductase [bacterium]|nr:FAD-binding oxidoreductase [bacterium]
MTIDRARTSEIAIIGAGVTGLAIASHLVELGCRQILVLDKFPFPGCGSSGKSAGGFRQQFSNAALITLAKTSKPFFDTFSDRFDFPLNFKKRGYLLLAQSDPENQQLVEDCRLQHSHGLPVEHFGPRELARRFPYLETNDLAGANLCLEDGYLDPNSLLQAYGQTVAMAKQPVFFDTEVQSIRALGSNPGFVLTTSRGNMHARIVVIAAGAWSASLANRLGETLPLEVRKRQIFVSAPFPAIPESPLVIQGLDPLYFRKEGDSFILSIAEIDPVRPEQYDDPPLDWSHASLLAERAATRVPLFNDLCLRRAWAGLRTLTPDSMPILGQSTVHENLYYACGLSGHGICFSPAVGNSMAQLILHHDQHIRLFLEPFDPARFKVR